MRSSAAHARDHLNHTAMACSHAPVRLAGEPFTSPRLPGCCPPCRCLPPGPLPYCRRCYRRSRPIAACRRCRSAITAAVAAATPPPRVLAAVRPGSIRLIMAAATPPPSAVSAARWLRHCPLAAAACLPHRPRLPPHRRPSPHRCHDCRCRPGRPPAAALQRAAVATSCVLTCIWSKPLERQTSFPGAVRTRTGAWPRGRQHTRCSLALAAATAAAPSGP